MMHRRRSNDRRKALLSSSPSARALIIFAPIFRSFAQNGTSPQRNVPSRRTPPVSATAYVSSVGGSVAGLVIETAGGHDGSAAAAAPASAPPLRAAVTADGAPVGAPSGWRVQHVDRGRYRLEFDHDVRLSIASWELPTTVMVR